MLASEIILQFLTKVKDGVIEDASSKNQKIPVSSFRVEVEGNGGKFWTAHYMQYLIYGRPPGGMPPLEPIAEWAEKNIRNPVRENKDGTFSFIPYESLAFAIAKKIQERGTEIWEGKREGVDLLGVMESNMPQFLKDLAANEAAQIATNLRNAIR